MSFFRKLAEAFKNLVTAKDGDTYAPSRMYWLFAAVTQLFLSIWSVVVQNTPFSSTDFGTGMGLILVAGGVGVWITAKTEPGQ